MSDKSRKGGGGEREAEVGCGGGEVTTGVPGGEAVLELGAPAWAWARPLSPETGAMVGERDGGDGELPATRCSDNDRGSPVRANVKAMASRTLSCGGYAAAACEAHTPFGSRPPAILGCLEWLHW